jgi:hypothetical protein
MASQRPPEWAPSRGQNLRPAIASAMDASPPNPSIVDPNPPQPQWRMQPRTHTAFHATQPVSNWPAKGPPTLLPPNPPGGRSAITINRRVSSAKLHISGDARLTLHLGSPIIKPVLAALSLLQLLVVWVPVNRDSPENQSAVRALFGSAVSATKWWTQSKMTRMARDCPPPAT